jgi:hypothetical protein
MNTEWHRHEVVTARLVEVLRYKPEGRGLDSRWGTELIHGVESASN